MDEERVEEARVAYSAAADRALKDVTVAEMTAQELRTLIQSALKEALQEVLGDPDADLELRPEFEERLRQAVNYVASGGRLLSMEELNSRLEDVGGV
jgi:hypothetical protein